MEEKEELVLVNFKMPRTMFELMVKAVSEDTHVDRSEFMRDAIREKLVRRGLLSG